MPRSFFPTPRQSDGRRREDAPAAWLPSLGGGVCAIAVESAAFRAPRSSLIVSPLALVRMRDNERFRAHGRRAFELTLARACVHMPAMDAQVLNTARVRPQAPVRHARQLAPCAWRSQRGIRVQVKHAFMCRGRALRTSCLPTGIRARHT